MAKRRKSAASMAASRIRQGQKQRQKMLQKVEMVNKQSNTAQAATAQAATAQAATAQAATAQAAAAQAATAQAATAQAATAQAATAQAATAQNMLPPALAKNDYLFVSVAAFCDSYLRFTLQGLFDTARYPERIVVGVVDQSFTSQYDWIKQHQYADQIRYIHLDPVHSRGVCWARSLVQSLYDNEHYYLQIDSHTWFAQDWDDHLIRQIAQLQHFTTRPILTIYPPPFEFDEHQKPYKKLRETNNIGFFEFKNIDDFNKDSLVLRAKVAYHALPNSNQFHAVKGYYLSGGFVMTLGAFVNEIPYDPGLYFHGEEQALAVRAFTHGWDIFHICYRDVPLYHLYKVPNVEHESQHWRKDIESRRRVKFHQRRDQANQRLRQLVHNELPPPYGLGQSRSLDDYAALSGIDYQQGQLTPPPKPCIVTTNFAPVSDKAQAQR